MGYELREIDPNGIYHVICKGNNGGPLVFDKVDCDNLRDELGKVALKYEWDIFAWCLVINHYHVLMRTPKGGFSEGFQELNGNHSRRTNRRNDRRDHLFRHRPYAVPVLSEAHFGIVVLYISLNPVAAGLCPNARAWKYGSYRALVGHEPAPRWLALREVLRSFGSQPEEARRALVGLVEGGPVLVSNTNA
ncbi:MAG TPA: transposase [Gaiellaceae bacterium]|jgi:REP element-mobilizing transposase RayT